VWHSVEGGYILCGIAGRAGMYFVAQWGGSLCIVWHSGEGGCMSCGIVVRAGMYHVA